MIPTMNSLISMCAGEIMSADMVMIPREMSLPGAARLLARGRVTGAPVVDAEGHCIGVLSPADFVHWVEDEHRPTEQADPMCSAWQIPESETGPGSRVESVMNKNPVRVSPETRIPELARRMFEAHVHRVIVVDTISQKPLGVVSSMDILAVLARLESSEKVNENTPHFHSLRKEVLEILEHSETRHPGRGGSS